jgi:hypothetical protein
VSAQPGENPETNGLTARRETGKVPAVATIRPRGGGPRPEELARELATLRAKGLDRLESIEAPALRSCIADLTHQDPSGLKVHHLEVGLGAGITAMGEGQAAECAAVLFGLASHVRGLHPIELRKRAAEQSYDRPADQTTVDAFRKTREPRVLAALATALLRAVDGDDTGVASTTGETDPADAAGGARLPGGRLIVDQPTWRQRTLPVLLVEPRRPGQLRELTWLEFGQGIETLRDQVHHYGTNLDIDLAIGINEAGLVMATLLASASFSRCAVGYVRTRSRGTSLGIDEQNTLLGPQVRSAAAVLICDYEVKTTHVISRVCEHLVDAGLPAGTPCYFAVMGALATEKPTLDAVQDLDVAVTLSRLPCQPVLQAAQLTDTFVGCLMPRPGIDPPLALR